MSTEIPERVKEAIEVFSKQQGFKNHCYEINYVPAGINGLNSRRYKVIFSGETFNGKKTMELFIKTMFRKRAENTSTSQAALFDAEIYCYTKLAKVIRKFESEYKIPEEDSFKMIKYYDVNSNDTLLFDDMFSKGYTVKEPGSIVSVKFAKLALDQLVKLHSLSIIMKKVKPDLYEQLTSEKFGPRVFTEEYNIFLNRILQLVESVLTPGDAKDRLKKFWDGIISKIKKAHSLEDSNMNVIIHGDFRAGNVMLKEKDGVETETILLDFQQFFSSNPTRELFYFLANDTDTEFRKKHLYHIRDYYYDTLKKNLLNYKIDLGSIYSREAYEEDFRSRLFLLVIFSCGSLAFTLPPSGSIPDYSKHSIGGVNIGASDKYAERIRNVIDEAIEMGIM